MGLFDCVKKRFKKTNVQEITAEGGSVEEARPSASVAATTSSHEIEPSEHTILTASKKLFDLFESFIHIVPKFEVLSGKYIPDGLNPHTRSICWLAEQVILQNTSRLPQIAALENPESDVSAWDARITFTGPAHPPLFVNIKVSSSKKRLKNDIASVKKLKAFYDENPNALLFFVVLKFDFDTNWIIFEPQPIVQYYPWMADYYVNPRNHHIQAHYDCGDTFRTTNQFISEFMATAIEKGLA